MQRWDCYGNFFLFFFIIYNFQLLVFTAYKLTFDGDFGLGFKGVEKLIASKMMLPGSNRRIHSVHRHSGMVLSFTTLDLILCTLIFLLVISLFYLTFLGLIF